jgi:uncharacterized iron-regulated membrane protein
MVHLLLILAVAFLASGVLVTALEEWAEHRRRPQEPTPSTPTRPWAPQRRSPSRPFGRVPGA